MKYASFLIAILLLVSCKKYRDLGNDAKGDLYIKGRLYTADSVKGNNLLKPAGRVTVKLSTDENMNETYLVSVATDSEGYFIFKNLHKETYFISAETIDSNVIYYNKQKVELTGSVTDFNMMLVIKQSQQNGVVYEVRDSVGSILKDVEVCFFSNHTIANDSCAGSNFSTNTNSFGLGSAFNVAPATYKVYFKATYNGTKYTGTDMLTVTPEGVAMKTIELYVKPPVSVVKDYGVMYTFKDSLGGIITGGTVCMFNSFVIANDSCKGSNHSDVSDKDGVVTFKNIARIKYVSYFKFSFDTTVYKAIDTIQIIDTGIIKRDIILRK